MDDPVLFTCTPQASHAKRSVTVPELSVSAWVVP
jgi:hypothetical protein